MAKNHILTTSLWLLYAAFLARVLGQILVVLGLAPWLPPFEQWQSGIVSYPVLLALQFLILLLFAKIATDITRGRGYFSAAHPLLSKTLKGTALMYGVIMIGRYLVIHVAFPTYAHLAPAIPTVLHIDLAAFILLASIAMRDENRALVLASPHPH